MNLSLLQQHILAECYRQKGEKIERNPFVSFYTGKNIKESLRVKIITQSLERLIDRGYLIGYGVRTPKKWFIREVRITRDGAKFFERWLARRQGKLPLK